MTEIRISTLGDMHDHGYRIDVWCNRCGRGTTMTVERLVEKLGRHHPTDVRRALRCKECKGKDVETRIRPPAPMITDREDY